MFESKAECVAVCMRTTQGHHVLYRDFGGNSVDATFPNVQRTLTEQVSTYYPDINEVSVNIDSVESNGQFKYSINIRG